MAAQPEPIPRTSEIIELRRLGARELSPLLLEESVEWARELDWDFSSSADLVRKYADMRALGGAALMDRGEVAGYGYTVLEDRKGLIGDLYVRPAWRDCDSEVRLFRALLDTLAAAAVNRVESQLMLVGEHAAKELQRERFVRLYERLLLTLDASVVLPEIPSRNRARFRAERWGDHLYDGAANVIALSYAGHIDSQINDQYRTFGGARRFLHNIVQYPGCGDFYRPASHVVWDQASGSVAGVVLTSFVAAGVAHITQLCVAPPAQGAGLGYEMLRQAVADLRFAGALRISLTVTSKNHKAVELYRRCGFRHIRSFFAYVWECL